MNMIDFILISVEHETSSPKGNDRSPESQQKRHHNILNSVQESNCLGPGNLNVSRLVVLKIKPIYNLLFY